MSAYPPGTPLEPPPRVGRHLFWRMALGATLIVLLTGGAVASAGLLEIKHAVDIFNSGSTPIPNVKDVLSDVSPGGPQTILVLGSDKRYADTLVGGHSRSDTMLLVRLDPNKAATTVMSIPRDLKVAIPGHGVSKINDAYYIGGPKLAVQTVKQLLGIGVNHVVNVNFGGFKKAVSRLGCVYADVDRHYFNSNNPPAGGGGLYATIDVQAGYQKLCGHNALDYVRYRHFDTDLVRAARQQDFLRQAKDQIGLAKIFDNRDELLRIFGRYTQTDIHGTSAILQLLKLTAESAGNPIQEVQFPGDAGPSYVTVTPANLQLAVKRFMNAKSSPGARGKTKVTNQGKRARDKRKARRQSSLIPPGLLLNKTAGEDEAIALANRTRFPVYYPTLMAVGARYTSSDRRAYSIADRDKHRYQAYRIVVNAGQLGQYYGIQGTTWPSPPILDNPSEKRTMGGRTYNLFYDGSRLRIVSWRSPRGQYWVANTLLHTLTNQQMLGIARSLRRVGT